MLRYHEERVTECVMSIMTEQQMRARLLYVIGPDGSPLTVSVLPPPTPDPWVSRRRPEAAALSAGRRARSKDTA